MPSVRQCSCLSPGDEGRQCGAHTDTSPFVGEVGAERPEGAHPVGSTKRFFAAGGFFTPDRKAEFIAPAMPAPHAALSEHYPFRLNTGRVRDQWHTMTRSGLSPRLCAHAPEPFVAVHPADRGRGRMQRQVAPKLPRGRTDDRFPDSRIQTLFGLRPGSGAIPAHPSWNPRPT